MRMVQKQDFWAVPGLRVALLRWASDLSAHSQFRLPTPRVKQIICNFSFGSIWKDFSESCCNQGPQKSGADTLVRKTALKTLMHLAVSNLEADFAC